MMFWGGLRCSFHLSFAYSMYWNSDCFPDGLSSLIRVRFASLATWSRPRAARPEDHTSLNAAFACPFHAVCTENSSRCQSSLLTAGHSYCDPDVSGEDS